MPATPVLKLPYPSLDDTPDVPRDLSALATKLDKGSGTTLPASPADGDQAVLVAQGDQAVAWHLRYLASAPAGQRWLFVGGAPAERYVDDAVYRNNVAGAGSDYAWAEAAAYATSAISPLVLPVPVAGIYDVYLGARSAYGDQPGQAFAMSFAQAAPGADGNLDRWGMLGQAILTTSPSGLVTAVSRARSVRKALTAGEIRAYHRATYGISTYSDRVMRLTPVAIGG